LRKVGILMGLYAALAGCAASPDPASLSHDPFAEENRDVHEINKQIDGAVYGPVARAYGNTVPRPVRRGITNLRNNWRLPGQVIQYGLQGRGEDAAKSTTRFAVNTLLGLGGLLDIAVDMGLPYDETNFDETFYVWGLPEGGYLELPFIGPGTQRDWTGYVLDQALDPAFYVLPVAAANSLIALGGLDIVNDRYELDTAMQSLLHESADSYTALRISYIQNMRARLQGGTDVGQLEDIYADE
jgi:phospholipid-binding lipoprotein MlaA